MRLNPAAGAALSGPGRQLRLVCAPLPRPVGAILRALRTTGRVRMLCRPLPSVLAQAIGCRSPPPGQFILDPPNFLKNRIRFHTLNLPSAPRGCKQSAAPTPTGRPPVPAGAGFARWPGAGNSTSAENQPPHTLPPRDARRPPVLPAAGSPSEGTRRPDAPPAAVMGEDRQSRQGPQSQAGLFSVAPCGLGQRFVGGHALKGRSPPLPPIPRRLLLPCRRQIPARVRNQQTDNRRFDIDNLHRRHKGPNPFLSRLQRLDHPSHVAKETIVFPDPGPHFASASDRLQWPTPCIQLDSPKSGRCFP